MNRSLAWLAASRYAAVLLLLVGIAAYFGVSEGARFLSRANIENMLGSVSILWIVAVGMTFVVLTGGIDLSVGAVVALSGLVLAKLFNGAGVPALLAVVLTVGFGAVLGAAVNGVLIGRARLSFFVVTLGTASLYQGIVSIWSHTETEYIDSSLVGGVGFGSALGVTTPIWIMLGVFLVAFAILRWTYFGRDVYAVGGNLEAARLSGINTTATLVSAYAIVGSCAALAGVVQAGRLGASSPDVGADIPLSAAAAVLLGGTSFVGGIGGVTGTAVGVLFIGTLQNGLAIKGVSSFWQQVVTGVILVVAVGIDRIQQNPQGIVLRRRLREEEADDDG
jgi:ribose/xylose/arabinose/galactoside ABC-type transport system permease subunit